MSMDFPSSPINGQTTTDGRYYFDSSVGESGAWRSTPLPVGGLPAGSIMAWGTNTPPANWLIADGSAVSRSVYSSLFAVIGTQYGAGNGTTTFNLPDLRGRVPVGQDATGSRIPTNSLLGQSAGAATHTLNANEMPSHSHSFSATTTNSGSHTHGGSGGNNFVTNGGGVATANISTGGGGYALNTTTGSAGDHNHTVSGTTGTAGSGQAHNNLQPYQVVNYIIKFSAGWTAGDSELATRVGAIETADATTNRSGLVPVVPSSVVVGSGSGSVASDGTVTFTGASSISLNSAFTSAYRNYRVVTNFIGSTGMDVFFRARASGVDHTGANYMFAKANTNSTTFSIQTYSGSSSNINLLRAQGAGYYTSSSFDIYLPQLPTTTQILGQWVDGAFYGNSWASVLTSGQYDGFTISPNGTFTGTLQVYGYR